MCGTWSLASWRITAWYLPQAAETMLVGFLRAEPGIPLKEGKTKLMMHEITVGCINTTVPFRFGLTRVDQRKNEGPRFRVTGKGKRKGKRKKKKEKGKRKKEKGKKEKGKRKKEKGKKEKGKRKKEKGKRKKEEGKRKKEKGKRKKEKGKRKKKKDEVRWGEVRSGKVWLWRCEGVKG